MTSQIPHIDLTASAEHFDRFVQYALGLAHSGQFEKTIDLPHHLGKVKKQSLNLSMKGLELMLLEFSFAQPIKIDASKMELQIKCNTQPEKLPSLNLQLFHSNIELDKNNLLPANTPLYYFSLTLGHDYIVSFTENLKYDLPIEIEQTLSAKVMESSHDVKAISSKIQLYIQQLINCKQAEGLRRNIYLESKVLGLLNYLFQFFNDAQPNKTVAKFQLKDADVEKLNVAKALILQYLKDPMTIAELAKKIGLNENYLKRGFKETFRFTIHEFIQHERIENAKTLLSMKGASVSQVGYELGFSCVSHFSATFKKVAGVNPSELIPN